MDLEALHQKLDSLWPNQRSAAELAAERNALAEVVVDEGSEKRLVNLVEIYVTDKKPHKLPSLTQLILAGAKKVTRRPNVSNSSSLQVNQDKPDVTESLFRKYLSKWPENDIPQNESGARQAFYTAVRLKAVTDVELACQKYIDDMSDPKTASVHFFGMRKFLEDEDIFNRWLGKAKAVLNTSNCEFFDAVYAWYPAFPDKDDKVTVSESKTFYQRWVKDEEVVDFFFAVRSYSKQVQEEETEVKFVKRFTNFVRGWKKQPKWEQLAELSEALVIQSFRSRNIPYDCVYFGEHHLNAIKFLCLQANAEKEEVGIATVLTRHVENIYSYLASGKNYTGTVWTAPVDYTIVTEVLDSLRKEAVKLP